MKPTLFTTITKFIQTEMLETLIVQKLYHLNRTYFDLIRLTGNAKRSFVFNAVFHKNFTLLKLICHNHGASFSRASKRFLMICFDNLVPFPMTTDEEMLVSNKDFALALAIQQHNLEFTEYLLGCGANACILTTDFLIACMHSKAADVAVTEAVVARLVACKDINCHIDFKALIPHLIYHNCINSVKQLSHLISTCCESLAIAAGRNHLDILKYLITVGVTDFDDFAFLTAVDKNHIEIVKVLLDEQTSDIEAQQSFALIRSISRRYNEIAKMLIQKLKHLEQKNQLKHPIVFQKTLLYAVCANNIELAEWLIKQDYHIQSRYVDNAINIVLFKHKNCDLFTKLVQEGSLNLNLGKIWKHSGKRWFLFKLWLKQLV